MKVFSQNINETEEDINLDNLTAGIYLLSVSNEHQRLNKKIVIQY
jgi:hypothetical protein